MRFLSQPPHLYVLLLSKIFYIFLFGRLPGRTLFTYFRAFPRDCLRNAGLLVSVWGNVWSFKLLSVAAISFSVHFLVACLCFFLKFACFFFSLYVLFLLISFFFLYSPQFLDPAPSLDMSYQLILSFRPSVLVSGSFLNIGSFS